MAIKKVKIKNFKCFKGYFEIELNKGLNILVGNNDAGKSTILEAINMALTGLYRGRSIKNELSQYLFNSEIVDEYLASINNGTALKQPEIIIEIYFDGSLDPEFEGDDHSDKGNVSKYEGIKFVIAFDDRYNDEYNGLLETKNVRSLPIEYYDCYWSSFARQKITTKSIPIKSAMIDSSSYRFSNGSDVYISRIVKDLLTDDEITAVSQAHRHMKDSFIGDDSIKAINERIGQDSSIVDGKISLTVDLGTKNAWENSLVTQLNEIPFGNIGKGAQCVMKTELALTHKSARKAQIVLLEEPESHLSFSKLNQLIESIQSKYNDKQIIVSTHSSYVANKLGLENLLLLKEQKIIKIANLSSAKFFKKIAGYDTLRMMLCNKAILVEGDSDELIVQKAYLKKHNRLPIQDQIDVISVGTSFLRFLELAEELNQKVAVVTDNDGDVKALENKYKNYIRENKKENIDICYDSCVDTGNFAVGDKPYNYNTLEPKMLKANANNISLFNSIFNTNYEKIEDIWKYMQHKKTEVALAIFETSKDIKFPEYILEAIKSE